MTTSTTSHHQFADIVVDHLDEMRADLAAGQRVTSQNRFVDQLLDLSNHTDDAVLRQVIFGALDGIRSVRSVLLENAVEHLDVILAAAVVEAAASHSVPDPSAIPSTSKTEGFTLQR